MVPANSPGRASQPTSPVGVWGGGLPVSASTTVESHTGQYLHTGHTPTLELVQGDRQGREALGRAFISQLVVCLMPNSITTIVAEHEEDT